VSVGSSSAAGQKVAICATLSEDVPVQTALLGTGLYSAVDILNCETATPSVATLQGYSAVLAFPDSEYNDFAALAQNLATYVDGGGHLVLAQWGFASCCGTWWGTALDTGGYLPYTGSNVKDSSSSLSLVKDDAGSPLLAGVNAVGSPGSDYVAIVGLSAGATSVAHWSDGQSAVAFKGNVVALNVWPSSDGTTGDWVQLVANALGASGTVGSRGGYCSVKGNTNPFTGAAIPPGTFLDLTGGQAASDTHYTGAVPANYLQGLGITCDVLPGYVKTGETVGYFGSGDPGMYIYYKKAS